ncbi:hypothetical protein [Streptomyces sp. NPDC007025]|uniref:recombination directionality factor n=1 Tax=unclassified Streptomyces TaxID=2593676 RepID=UPI0036B4949C
MPHREYAGLFLSGRRGNNRPEPLTKWHLAARDAEIGRKVGEILGGVPERSNSTASHGLGVETQCTEILVSLDDANSVRLEMVQWGPSGVIHHCDGSVFLGRTQGRGGACGCPLEIEKRKEKAKCGEGPQPSAEIEFRLAKRPDLGIFLFRSNSWEFFESAKIFDEALAEGWKDVLCRLSIGIVELESGEGISLAYSRPVIEVLGN